MFPISKCALIMYSYVIVVKCQKKSMEVTVTPEKYVDDKQPYMEFTCKAHLDIGDKLSWNISRSKTQETVALYEERYGKGTKGLNLQWPLTPEDNNTEIFCFKEKIVNRTKSITKSENVHISFRSANGAKSREMLWIWPRRTVIVYDDKTPVHLACWAWLDTTSTTDQFVAWYQIFGSSRPERIAIMPQMNRHSYVKIDLKRFFKPMDSRTEIFCASEHILANLSSSIGLRSQRILLIHQDEPDPSDQGQVTVECGTLTKLGWMITAVLIVLAALAMAGLAFAFFILCFGKSTIKSKSI